MNKANIYIAAGLFLIIFLIGMFALNYSQKTNNEPVANIQNATLFNSIEGDFNVASITYTTYEPEFKEVNFPLDSSKIEVDEQADLIYYEMELLNLKIVSILINKKNNTIVFSGFDPQDTISVIKNSTKILNSIPTDWYGRLTLSNDDVQISDNLCFKLENQNITVCHAIAGGVR